MPRGRKEKPRDAKKLAQKDVFTTFDVSRICQANIASIKNWIMKGYLKAFRTPGGHYRIQKKDLVAFLRKYHMPNPFTGETLRIYAYAADKTGAEKIVAKWKGEHEGFAFSSEPDLLVAMGEEMPDALIVDVDSFEPAALKTTLDFIVGKERFEGIRLVALAADEAAMAPFHRTVKKGAQAKRIVEAILEVL